MSPHGAVPIAVALVACVFDLRSQRIPNALTFGAAAAALLVAAVGGGMPALGWSLAGWLLGLALFLPIYALGGMGAGDVKLLAAIGAWLGPMDVFYAALYTGIAGGFLALGVAVWRGCLRQTWRNVQLLVLHWHVAGLFAPSPLTLDTATSPKLAYALPTFIGTAVAIWVR
jgi:prepilin peptidase CpaA